MESKTSLARAGEPAYRIKPLEWETLAYGDLVAQTVVGTFNVIINGSNGKRFTAWCNNTTV